MAHNTLQEEEIRDKEELVITSNLSNELAKELLGKTVEVKRQLD